MTPQIFCEVLYFPKDFTAEGEIFVHQVKIDWGESKHINIVRPCRNIIVSSAYALTSPARSQSISSMCVQDNAIPSGLPWLVLFGLRLTKISRDIRNGVAYKESQVTSWRNFRAIMTFHASHAREHAHLGISGAN